MMYQRDHLNLFCLKPRKMLHLTGLIAELSDRDRLDRMVESLQSDRPRLSWEHTAAGYLALVEGRLA